MIPAAAYIRVSSEMQVEIGSSLPSQLDAIREYASRNGYVVHDDHVYSDEAASARTADRPAFQRMIALAKSDRCPWKAIICWENSRFARSREDAVVYKALLRKKGISLLFVKQDFGDTPIGRLMEGIVEIVDQWYSENLAIETKRGQTQNAKAGYSTGGRPPYGLRRIEVRNEYGAVKAKWEPDPETSKVVRRIYELYAKKIGYKKLAYTLNAEAIPSPSGGLWNANTLYYILWRNQPAYLGTLIYNREDNERRGKKTKPEETWTVNEGAWEAILTPEEVAAVNQLRSKKERHKYVRDGSENESKTPFLLTGKVVCGVCGSAVTGSTGGRKNQSWRYYRCGKAKSAGPSACSLGSVAQWKLEGAVIQAIKDYFVNPEFIAEVLADFRERAQMDDGSRRNRLAEVEKGLKRREAERQKLISMVVKGLITDDEARPLLDRAAHDLAGLRCELASLEMTKDMDFDAYAASAEEFRQAVAGMLELGGPAAYAGMVDSMISKVVLYPDKVHIEFEWDPQATERELSQFSNDNSFDLPKVGGEGGI